MILRSTSGTLWRTTFGTVGRILGTVLLSLFGMSIPCHTWFYLLIIVCFHHISGRIRRSLSPIITLYAVPPSMTHFSSSFPTYFSSFSLFFSQRSLLVFHLMLENSRFHSSRAINLTETSSMWFCFIRLPHLDHAHFCRYFLPPLSISAIGISTWSDVVH